MIWIRLLCLAVGYCFGAIQTAFFYGKLKGIDIREHGSGNAGTTNTLRVLGTKAGLIVFAGDMLKSILAIVLVRLIFKGICPDALPLLCLYTGAGCVLGHNFPFYMNFKGGKGIASTGGIMIAMHWLYVPVGLVVFFGTFFLTHYVSLGSLLLYLTFFVETVVLGELGIYGVTREILIEMYIIVFLLTVMAYWKHRGNISRLIHGNERKTYLSHKNQEKAKEENK
ncbi:MAG: glycerol-3-phosphate 1-O-acyltransferase PlsY [Lachnospiraceae bacterium]|nr:glycerol-3-phosphate 1-O-acyltransferase PlsY [Lachnospiraceae bacterium]